MNEADPIASFLPEPYKTYVLLFFAVSPFLGRAFQALRNGGGIKGIVQAIWLGTNVPKTVAEDYKDIK